MNELKVSRRGLLKYFGAAVAVACIPSISGIEPKAEPDVAASVGHDQLSLDSLDELLRRAAQNISDDMEAGIERLMLENAHG